MNDSKYRLHLGLTLAVMVFIFIQSALSGDLSGAESQIFVNWITSIFNVDAETVSFLIRKAAHFTEYTILGLCLCVNVNDWIVRNPQNTMFKWRHIWGLAWIIGTAYAITDEAHQRFVAGRSGEVRDICIDAAGVAIGAAVMLLILRHRNYKEKQFDSKDSSF